MVVQTSFCSTWSETQRQIFSRHSSCFPGTILEVPEILDFAKLGCYLDYDLFGIETSNYQQRVDTDMPSDAERLDRIKALVDAGFGDKVTVGQDIHTKHRLVGYLSQVMGKHAFCI